MMILYFYICDFKKSKSRIKCNFMVDIATLNLLDINFYPESGSDIVEKLNSCYSQFLSFISNKGLKKEVVVKQTIFISSQNQAEYIQNKQKLFSCAKLFFEELPPTSILSQSPDNESLVLEISLVDGARSGEIIYKEKGESRWCVFQRGKTKLIFAAGIGSENNTDDILEQSTLAFRLAQQILEYEEMSFSNVVRQWNYIAQITANIEKDGRLSQHYQIFNDVRSKYYGKSEFQHGYPAATGIGMDFGGVMLDFIAARFDADNFVVRLKSPVQFDAYTYSKEVLADNCSMSDFCRTTPKFERAKLMNIPGNRWIFISGTAAIVGEESDLQKSVEHQTEMTIENIRCLISPSNLNRFKIQTDAEPEITYLRVYVKYKSDLLPVEQICRKHFKNIPLTFVVADICRPELLVEIEGFAVLA